MKNYIELIQEYNAYYIDKLESNKDKLIEAFVIYYGEEYRDLIVERYNEIIFCWYLSDFTKNIYNEYICKVITNKRINHTIKILNILGYDDLKINSIKKGRLLYKNDTSLIFPGNISSVYCEDKKIDNVLKNIFGKNNIFNYDYDSKLYNFFSLNEKDKLKFVKKVFKINEINNDVLEKIKEAICYMDDIKKEKNDDMKYIDFALFSKYLGNSDLSNKVLCVSDDILFSEEWKYVLDFLNDSASYIPFLSILSSHYKMIMLPMLYINDTQLIHEVNHAITCSALANIEGTFVPYAKTGLTNTFDEKHGLEEILNEISCIEISKIFSNLGGSILNDRNYEVPLVNTYEKIIPLVKPFYFKYKNIIDKARLTENDNILYKYIDKNKFFEFKDLIFNILNSVEKRIKNTKGPIYYDENFIADKEYEKANKLINEMDYKPSIEMSIEEYAKLLINEYNNINIINHDDIGINHKKK